MADGPRVVGAAALAGVAAGLLVGFGDGIRAALLVGTGFGTALATGLLVAAVDGLGGFAAGAAVELMTRLASWGRRARAPLAAMGIAYLLAGAGCAAAVFGVVAATTQRNNRLLAGGLTTLAGVAAALAAVLLAPALARLIAGRRARHRAPPQLAPAAALLVPAVVFGFGLLVFICFRQTRAGVSGATFVRLVLWTAVPAALLPVAIAAVATVRLKLGWRRAAALAAIVYGGLAAAGLAIAWNDHLRFAPWTDILVCTAGVGLAGLLLVWWRERLPSARGRAAAVALGIAGGVILVLFRAAELDAARKVASARAGLVGPVLAAGRLLLDSDGDRHARALGGHDCDDSDPTVHPGAVDLPGDGTDADCDGQDATDALPPPARMVALPPAVPADLNLLLITIDTLRADHLGCYGYPRATSPVIDRLAAEGALFENGWAHAPSTRYSMPAIAAGRWPSAITWDESIWWPRLGLKVRTTAEALHDAGYVTGGLFSFNYFAPQDRRGFERGMDVYRADRAALHVAVNGPMESRGSSSREITDDAIAFIDERRGRRFFLWVHYYDPHLGYEDHAEVPPFGSSRVDRYDGEIRFTDLHLGRLVAHLRASGSWDKTAVVLTGDHGEGFGEHGVTEHGFDLYGPQTKVPFIVRVPGLAPRRVRVPVGHIDIAPTLVNLGRGREEPAFFGRSLVPELAGPAVADTETRAVFQEVTSERGKKRALVTAGHHLVWNAVPSDTIECYDLSRDPAETRDIWDSSSGDTACTKLAGDLKRLVAGMALPAGVAEKLARAVTPPGRPGPVPSTALEANLGKQIGLRGYSVSATDVRAGDVLDVTYDFISHRPVGPGWRLLFHLDGPTGTWNVDHEPVDGLMPLQRWRPGQRIRDHQRIPILAGTRPGVYTMYVGAARGGARLPVDPPALSDGKDRLRLFSVVVR